MRSILMQAKAKSNAVAIANEIRNEFRNRIRLNAVASFSADPQSEIAKLEQS